MLNKCLIIEGQDNCGKSTLIDYLRKQVITSPKATYIHSSSPPSNITVDKLSWEMMYYEHTFTSISEGLLVCDRAHIGAYVYGAKYRGYDENSFKRLDSLEEFLPEQTYLITIVDSPSGIKSRDDGLSFESDDNEYIETREAFMKAHERSSIKSKILIDLTENNIEDLNLLVINFLEEEGFFNANNKYNKK